jgi:hypothetical protein
MKFNSPHVFMPWNAIQTAKLFQDFHLKFPPESLAIYATSGKIDTSELLYVKYG